MPEPNVSVTVSPDRVLSRNFYWEGEVNVTVWNRGQADVAEQPAAKWSVLEVDVFPLT